MQWRCDTLKHLTTVHNILKWLKISLEANFLLLPHAKHPGGAQGKCLLLQMDIIKNIQTHIQHENRESSVIPLAFSCTQCLFCDGEKKKVQLFTPYSALS